MSGADVTPKEKTTLSSLAGQDDGTTLQTTFIAGDRSRDDDFTSSEDVAGPDAE